VKRSLLVTLAIMAAALATSHWIGVGRRFWYPYWMAHTGARTHEGVLIKLRPQHQPALKAASEDAGVPYPPGQMVLVGLKKERLLEVWTGAGRGYRLLRSYPVLAASGHAGPKLREGDRQVPEGFYRVIGFNPNSSYHLSLRIDYPNDEDRAAAQTDGRSDLGGDIFIHGKAVSIGCVAIGDSGIEELYVLLADVGLRNVKVLLAPSAQPDTTEAPEWLRERYGRLRGALQQIRAVGSQR
jgi:murein L,D-transpeptidase YafK